MYLLNISGKIFIFFNCCCLIYFLKGTNVPGAGGSFANRQLKLTVTGRICL